MSSNIPPPVPNYEFTTQQNTIIGSLAHSMRGVGTFFFVLGAAYLIMAVLSAFHLYRQQLLTSLDASKLIIAFCAGVIWIYIGSGFRKSAAQFQKIVTTAGSDISHLMTALLSLRGVFSLIYSLILLLILLLILGLGSMVTGMLFVANPAVG
jgi:hypothetical protein